MSATPHDPFLEEVQRLKRDAAERTPTVEDLARRLREIEQAHQGKVVQPPAKPRSGAA